MLPAHLWEAAAFAWPHPAAASADMNVGAGNEKLSPAAVQRRTFGANVDGAAELALPSGSISVIFLLGQCNYQNEIGRGKSNVFCFAVSVYM